MDSQLINSIYVTLCMKFIGKPESPESTKESSKPYNNQRKPVPKFTVYQFPPQPKPATKKHLPTMSLHFHPNSSPNRIVTHRRKIALAHKNHLATTIFPVTATKRGGTGPHLATSLAHNTPRVGPGMPQRFRPH